MIVEWAEVLNAALALRFGVFGIALLPPGFGGGPGVVPWLHAIAGALLRIRPLPRVAILVVASGEHAGALIVNGLLRLCEQSTLAGPFNLLKPTVCRQGENREARREDVGDAVCNRAEAIESTIQEETACYTIRWR